MGATNYKHLLEDQTLHQQEESVADFRGTDLSQLSQREDLKNVRKVYFINIHQAMIGEQACIC